MSKVPLFILSFFIALIIWISVSLSSDYYYTLKLPLKITNLDEGSALAGDIPSEIQVKLKARGWRLAGILLGSNAELLVDAKKDTGRINIRVANAIGENSWLTSDIQVLEYIPASLNIKLDKLIRKQMPVVPQIEYTAKSGYGLASDIICTPESVLVGGSKTRIDRMRWISTVKSAFNDLQSPVVETVPLEYSNNLVVSPDVVTVHIDIQKIVDKEFNGIQVLLEDVPGDRQVVLIPPQVTVGLEGGVSLLGKLSPEVIKVTLRYKKVVQDTLGYVVPDVSVPAYLRVVSVKPDKIRYIIKKF